MNDKKMSGLKEYILNNKITLKNYHNNYQDSSTNNVIKKEKEFQNNRVIIYQKYALYEFRI